MWLGCMACRGLPWRIRGSRGSSSPLWNRSQQLDLLPERAQLLHQHLVAHLLLATQVSSFQDMDDLFCNDIGRPFPPRLIPAVHPVAHAQYEITKPLRLKRDKLSGAHPFCDHALNDLAIGPVRLRDGATEGSRQIDNFGEEDA